MFLAWTFILPRRGKILSFDYSQDETLSVVEWVSLPCGASLYPIIFYKGYPCPLGILRGHVINIPRHPTINLQYLLDPGFALVYNPLK